MKKLIAISVMFALLVGAAFAQVSGAVETRVRLASGSFEEDAKWTTSGGIEAAHLQLAGSSEDGTFGGLVRFRNIDVMRNGSVDISEYAITYAEWLEIMEKTNNFDPTPGSDDLKENVILFPEKNESVDSGAWFHRVFVWWRPIPQLRVFLGIDQDGMFGTDVLEGWAFHQGGESYITIHEWDFWRKVFPGNWDGFGMAFSVYPVRGLEVNMVVPLGNLSWPQAIKSRVEQSTELAQMYPGSLRFMGAYAIPDVGRVFFTYNGPGSAYADAANYGQLGLSFLLTAVAGLQVHIGGSTLIPKEGEKEDINVGLAAHWSGEGFGAKFRAAAVLGEEDAYITANVMPWYALDKITAFLDLGLATKGENLGWWVTPYIKMPAGPGFFSIGAQIYSGVSLGNQGVKADDPINFAIPMRLSYSF